MPPKTMFKKEDILIAALKLVRERGEKALTARALAAELGCSVKPIFGFFRSMEEVRTEVIREAERVYESFIREEVEKGEYPVYKSTGMAYIRFAREEKELFGLLFMRNRRSEKIEKKIDDRILNLVCQATGLDRDTAYLFHLETWVYVHGIASMLATGYLEWDDDFISNSLSDCFLGLKEQLKRKEQGENDCR